MTVVMKDGRRGRLLRTLTHGYVVQFDGRTESVGSHAVERLVEQG